jgi:hypothetical protein
MFRLAFGKFITQRFIFMKSKRFFNTAAFVAILFASSVAPAAGTDDSIRQDELVRRTQELFDSVTAGNQAPWKKYMTDDCVYFDEKGRNMDKATLVADITHLPTGYSGAIIAKVQSRIYGDTAILSYDADETETIFGQNLSARYHVTDTWLRRNGIWQIVAGQVFRYYEDPAIGKVDPKQLSAFIGTYELAPGQSRTISV